MPAIRAAGGYILGQDEATSDVYGMNKVAYVEGTSTASSPWIEAATGHRDVASDGCGPHCPPFDQMRHLLFYGLLGIVHPPAVYGRQPAAVRQADRIDVVHSIGVPTRVRRPQAGRRGGGRSSYTRGVNRVISSTRTSVP